MYARVIVGTDGSDRSVKAQPTGMHAAEVFGCPVELVHVRVAEDPAVPAATGTAWAPVAEAMPLEGIEIDLVELHVTDDMVIDGRRLAELAIPDGSIVTAIVRHDQVIVPKGDTRIRADDVLLITTQRQRDALQQLTAWARGEG